MPVASLTRSAAAETPETTARHHLPAAPRRRQGLALEPFEEGAAGGRDIGEAVRSRRPRLSAATVSPPPATETSLPACGRVRAAASATSTVPLSNGSHLEGAERPVPDQRLRRARAPRRHARWCAARCRGSSRRRPRCRPTTTREGAFASNSLRHHGIDRQHDLAAIAAFALARMSRAVGTRSCSHSDLPTACPCAARNVLAMPPPMISTFDLGDQIAEQIELGRDLGAADDRRDRALRRLRAPSRARRARPAWCGRHRPAACGRGPRSRHARDARPRRRR